MRERCGGAPGVTGRRRRRRPRAAAFCGLLAATFLAATVLAAAPAQAATTIGVAGAYDGSYVPGRPLAVRVQVAADRLLQGRLEVSVAEGTPVGVAVEVPGGSTKEFLVVVPGSQSFDVDGAVSVSARLRDGTNDLAAGSVLLQSSTGQEVVGLLPAALGGRAVPGPAPLAVDAGTARFVALGPSELAQAPASLGPLSTIAVAADELGRLPATTRDALLVWVEQGGHLLVDADAGAGAGPAVEGQAVEGLPDLWQPGRDGRAQAGRGEVRLTGGAIAAGRWAGLVEPTGWAVGGDPSARFGDVIVGRALAEEAGLRVPRLGWLVGFLVLYVLVSGPLVFFVVRRRKQPELAWLAVPLVAIMFTAGSYVGGRGLRHTTRQVDSSIVSTGAGGSSATTWLGVFSAGGQTSRLRFGPGWMPAGDTNDGTTTPLSSVTLNPDGAEGSLPLDAGQFGIVPSSGPVADRGRLEVTGVSAAAGEASGRVRNATPYPLDDVAVFAGTGGAAIGSLAPGEEREWRLEGTDIDFQFDGRPPPEFQVWGGFDGFTTAPRQVDFTLWDAAQQLGGQEFRGPGEVVVAGWTRAFAPPVAVDGKDAGDGGRSLVLGRGRVAATSDGGALDIRREVVRAPDFRGGRSESFVVRFVTRDADGGGRAPDPSRLTVRAPVASVDTWVDGAWRPIEPAIRQELELKGDAEFRLPAGAVQGDVVYLRFAGFSSTVDSNGLFTLREAP